MNSISAMTRYALYFTPSPGSPLWQAGSRWLGRDAQTGAKLPQPSIDGVPALAFERLTADARRYGLHATLKAPFRLVEGFTEQHLEAMAVAFARVQRPVPLEGLQVRPIDDFLALRPAEQSNELAALAMRCVSYFDVLRAPLRAPELAKRRRAGLSERQEALLQRWGYPYTEEEFRFHMTLVDSLRGVDENTEYAIRKAADAWFTPALENAPTVIDALSIFREDVPGAPFQLLKHIPFGAQAERSRLPAPGRLYFVVGPSGAGKDTLMRWVQQRTAARDDIVFARRTITRPAHESEDHEAVSTEEYWRLAASGHFSMTWQANGLHYGIRRGIEVHLKSGRDVVVNGSREYIPTLRLHFPQARVIWIDAEEELIRERIAARQREQGAALLRRLDRVQRFRYPEDGDIIRLDNSGPIEVAGARLMDILSEGS